MRRMVQVLAMAAITAAGGLGEQAAGQPELNKLQDLLERIRVKHDVPALAAALVTSDGMQLGAAVGVRKRGDKVAVTLDDQFHLGSNTKPMTAWLLAWLFERGLLAWDTPLEKYFPELAQDWPAATRQITLVHLLTHHAGLPANFPGGWWSIPVKDTPRAQRLVVMKKLGTVQLEAQPGAKFLYSNFGYTIAGALAERVAKDSWENLLQKNLFDLLKMKSAGYGPMGKGEEIAQPWQHRADGTPIAPRLKADNPPVMGPAGRVHCSLPDWSKFVAETLRGARQKKGLLKPATYTAMFATPFKDVFYCQGGWIGQGKNAQGKGMVLGHDGSNTHNYFSALLLPDQNLGVTVATNQGGKSGEKACHEVLAALIPKTGKEKK